MPIQEAFMTGKYHTKSSELFQDEMQRAVLLRDYQRSDALIADQGWPHPLRIIQAPAVIQIGTAGFPTSHIFSQFIRGINPYASLVVADYSPNPLMDCRANGMQMNKNNMLIRTDVTNLPFAAGSFHLAETDALFQFLSPDEKKQALAEIYRILEPGGIFTTRDKFVSKDASNKANFKLGQDRLFTHDTFGVMPYATTTEELYSFFREQGFKTIIHHVEEGDPTGLLFHDIIARKPGKLLDTKEV